MKTKKLLAKNLRYVLLAGVAALGLITILATGGGGGVTTTTSGTTLSGKVADGYVSGATVYIYSDQAMTNLIGSGTTDASGNFSISLSTASIPATVYIKTVGGTVIDTGMPAATMLFVGSGSLGNFNVTPITDSLFRYAMSMGITGATTHLETNLSLTSTQLYGDPVANSSLQSAVYEALASGTMGGTPPDGSYTGVFLVPGPVKDSQGTNYAFPNISTLLDIAKAEKNLGTLNFTISNGVLSGQTTDASGNTINQITGMVKGSSVLIDMGNSQHTQFTRFVGQVGVMGSVVGTFVSYDGTASPPQISSGFAVASIVPQGVNPAGLANVVSNTYPGSSGSRHFIYRDVFRDNSTELNMVWGDMTITSLSPGTPNGAVVADNMEIYADAGSTGGPTTDTLTFQEGRYLWNNNVPANIIILRFTNPGGGNVFIIQPVGSRRAVALITDANYYIKNRGEAYLASANNSIAPSLKANTTYTTAVAVAHAGMLSQSRASYIGGGSGMPYTDNITTPLDITSGYDTTAGILSVFDESIVAFLKDDDDNGLLDETDYMRVVELYQTGAMQGEQIMGGNVPAGVPGTYMSEYPATFVGFMEEQGSTAPSFSGVVNLLARTLYSTDYNDYFGMYFWGTLSTSGTSATLNWNQPGGMSGTATLTASSSHGLYHFDGAMGTDYIDIFWPVGAEKAVYIISDNSAGTGTITGVGEAYLTF